MFNQLYILWFVAFSFFIYVFLVDLRPIRASKRKVKNMTWAIEKTSFTLTEAACFIESIPLTSFENSSNAQSTLTELLYFAENYQLPLLQNGDSRFFDRPHPRPYVTKDSRVDRGEIENIKSKGISPWWNISAKANCKSS